MQAACLERLSHLCGVLDAQGQRGGSGVGREAVLGAVSRLVGAAHGDGVVREELLDGQGRDLGVDSGQLVKQGTGALRRLDDALPEVL